MSPRKEILNYATKRQRRWLTTLGEPIWGQEPYRGLGFERRNEKAFNELSSLIGEPTLEVWRNLFTRFYPDYSDLNAAGSGVFYYHHRDPETDKHIVKESRVIFSTDLIANSDLLSWDWIDHHRESLAQEWGLTPVSFGITGNMYTSLELDSLFSFSSGIGELGEHWFDETARGYLIQQGRQRFLVFVDIDEKSLDEQFLKACEHLGAPFLVADTKRGHHLLIPLLFFSDPFHSQREKEITARIGLIRGVNIHYKYIFRSLMNGEYVLRVTPGLEREETPTISAFVWDGKTIVREPASKSTG